MLTTNAKLTVKINDKEYALHLPPEAPLGEVHDALFRMRSFVLGKMSEALEVDKPKEAENDQL